MDCTEIEAHLALFIGGDLEAPLAALVGAHLGACLACEQRLLAAREARSALLGLAELEGDAGAVDLWPALRASLVSEGLCRPAAAATTALPPARGRLLGFSRAFAGMAAAAVVLLLWRPWVSETLDTNPSGGAAPLAGPIVDMGSQLDLAGLVIPAGGSDVASAEVPVVPTLLENAAPYSGGLRRAGPEDELLRNLARPFPGDAQRIQPMHQHGQGGWSLASDELR